MVSAVEYLWDIYRIFIGHFIGNWLVVKLNQQMNNLGCDSLVLTLLH